MNVNGCGEAVIDMFMAYLTLPFCGSFTDDVFFPSFHGANHMTMRCTQGPAHEHLRGRVIVNQMLYCRPSTKPRLEFIPFQTVVTATPLGCDLMMQSLR
ncbi:unnamed protein product [Periconia digitata]|uniref:Uncharacterized protein n=1 Tax=Periconia digitata TaxID=1303443 RepID=A0A9W4UCU0_9PLEO|nr:unnamed protein product [Periconia digitata]